YRANPLRSTVIADQFQSLAPSRSRTPKAVEPRRLARKARRRRAFVERGVLDPVLAEGGRQGGARKTLMVKNAVSQSRQFFTPVGCGVRCGQKDAGALFRQRLFRHVKAERGVARPTRKAERVERAPFKPRLDSADE